MILSARHLSSPPLFSCQHSGTQFHTQHALQTRCCMLSCWHCILHDPPAHIFFHPHPYISAAISTNSAVHPVKGCEPLPLPVASS